MQFFFGDKSKIVTWLQFFHLSAVFTINCTASFPITLVSLMKKKIKFPETLKNSNSFVKKQKILKGWNYEVG